MALPEVLSQATILRTPSLPRYTGSPFYTMSRSAAVALVQHYARQFVPSKGMAEGTSRFVTQQVRAILIVTVT